MNKIIICNLKENKTKQEFSEYLSKIDNRHDVDLIICPQLPYLHMINDAEMIKGAQDVSMYTNGAHTGEVSAQSLKEANVQYCIVGHKERKDSTKEVINKIINLIDNNIHPVLVIGEDEEYQDSKVLLRELESQLSEIYNQLPYDGIDKIIISYEPKWMIGNYSNIDKDKIKEIILTIKSIIYSYYEVYPKVIYGGGIDENKVCVIKEINELDGIIIGTKSLDVNDLNNIIKKYN